MIRLLLLLVALLVSIPAIAGAVSEGNSSTTPLTAGAVFTGQWINVANQDSIVVAATTDQNGKIEVQFSPDGSNVDSTLTRYYRTDGIEPPHRFTITRRYARVVFTNTSASNQTYLRLQTSTGTKGDLNAPIDSTLSRDFDAIVVRPTDETREIVLGRRQGLTAWNKFGYNEAVGASAEVVASWGGAFTPRTTATTLSIVSDDATDDDGNTGAHGIVIYGLDANRDSQTEVVLLDGLTPVVTTSTWLGINRIALFRAGTNLVNAGTITATAVTGGTTEGQVPAGQGTSQQVIFYCPSGHDALIEWATINVIRFGSGTEPVVTIKGWVYSPTSGAKYEVFRHTLDATLNNDVQFTPRVDFPIGDGAVFWFEATSSRADTEISARVSLIEARDADD